MSSTRTARRIGSRCRASSGWKTTQRTRGEKFPPATPKTSTPPARITTTQSSTKPGRHRAGFGLTWTRTDVSDAPQNPRIPEEILSFYDSGDEAGRLGRGIGPLEFARVRELI